MRRTLSLTLTFVLLGALSSTALGVDPAITAPAAGPLASNPVTFTWQPNDESPYYYLLRVGTTPAGKDVFDSGLLYSNTTSLEVGVTSGSLYATLYSYLPGRGWVNDSVTYTGPTQAGPEIHDPVDGAALTDTSVLFQWRSNGTPLSYWFLRVGSYQGGSDYHDSGLMYSSTLSRQVDGLPTDGSKVYARLYWYAGSWKSADFCYDGTTMPSSLWGEMIWDQDVWGP